MFADTGKIETGKFMAELPRDLRSEAMGEPEESKNITQAYKMSGEAKLKGIKEFLDNLFTNTSKPKFIIFAHH